METVELHTGLYFQLLSYIFMCLSSTRNKKSVPHVELEKQLAVGQWWCMPLISALRRQRHSLSSRLVWSTERSRTARGAKRSPVSERK